jgi:N-acetylneuraminate synthase
LGILYSYIDAYIAQTGVDAKFQMHIAEAESSEHEAFKISLRMKPV